VVLTDKGSVGYPMGFEKVFYEIDLVGWVGGDDAEVVVLEEVSGRWVPYAVLSPD
jgi:hypothetical protein